MMIPSVFNSQLLAPFPSKRSPHPITNADSSHAVALSVPLSIEPLGFFFHRFVSLDFAARVLGARWGEAGGRLATGAVGTFVGFPRLVGFVDGSGARLFAAAKLLRAGYNGISTTLLAPARVAFMFPSSANIVFHSHVRTFGLNKGLASASIAGDLTIRAATAYGAAVGLIESFANWDKISIVITIAGFRIVCAGEPAR